MRADVRRPGLSSDRYRRGRLPKNWPGLRAAVFRRDNYTCQQCGFTVGHAGGLDCDHIVPWHKGGAHTLSNLQTLCFACHRQKTRREISEAEPRIKTPGRAAWLEYCGL